MSESRVGHFIVVDEVHNFGGFFGGDTVTLTASTLGVPHEQTTYTIDEQVLVNVANRHTITAGMLLALEQQGERVERATLWGAREHANLRQALGPAIVDGPLDGPLVLSYWCPHCQFWLADAPTEQHCWLCHQPLS